MRIEKFEDVISWQKGKELFIEIDRLYKNETNRSFKDQIQRATLSITNNIAEGFDRGSDKELRQFLIISRGSCAEVRSMLRIGLALKKTPQRDTERLIDLTLDISRLLTGFINKLATVDSRQETTR